MQPSEDSTGGVASVSIKGTGEEEHKNHNEDFPTYHTTTGEKDRPQYLVQYLGQGDAIPQDSTRRKLNKKNERAK